MNWKDYVSRTIRSFRKQFETFEPGLKAQIQNYVYDESFLEPCQIEVSDLGKSRSVLWLVTHDPQRKDMEIIIHNNH